jgi:glutamate/aspartate transport system permease protein
MVLVAVGEDAALDVVRVLVQPREVGQHEVDARHVGTREHEPAVDEQKAPALLEHGAEFWAGVVALGVYHGARFSEVIRSGIQAIPKTQFEAALSTGLTMVQTYRLIIIPVALRLIVPPATNETLNLLKNSSVALTIGVAELTFQTRQIETYTAKAFEALAAGTMIYLVLCLTVALLMSQIERRTAIPGMIARGTGES